MPGLGRVPGAGGWYCLDEVSDAGGRAGEFAQEAPGLQGGDGGFDEGSDPRVGPVDGLLTCGELLPAAPAGDTDGASSSSVTLVRPARDVGLGQSVDDSVLAGGADVVDRARQGR